VNRRSIATLYGMVRLAKTEDCIGVAVFREPGMNFDLIAEADGDLRITRFLDLYPEQGYFIEPLPFKFDVKRRHSIGDPTPVPFLCDGQFSVVQGDRQPTDLTISPRSAGGVKVVADIKDLLGKARDGFFHKQFQRWRIEELRATFPEVFQERPNNSRYWVTRYRVAISRSHSGGSFSNELAAEFRSLGTRWLELFGTKTDFTRIRLLFDRANDGVFNREDVVASAFGFFCHKLSAREFQFLERAANDAYFLGLFPGGLYYHIVSYGYPRTPFVYGRPDDLLGELKRRLYRALDTYKLGKAKRLALALFGMQNAPAELREILGRLRMQCTQEYRTSREAYEGAFGLVRQDVDPAYQQYWDSREGHESLGKRLVLAFDALVDLEGIEYGDARLKSRENDYLVADRYFVDEVRRMIS
jgi:hypothetical protein